MIPATVTDAMMSMHGGRPLWKLQEDLRTKETEGQLELVFVKEREEPAGKYVSYQKLKTLKEFMDEHKIVSVDHLNGLTPIIQANGKISLTWIVNGRTLEEFDHETSLYEEDDHPYARRDG